MKREDAKKLIFLVWKTTYRECGRFRDVAALKLSASMDENRGCNLSGLVWKPHLVSVNSFKNICNYSLICKTAFPPETKGFSQSPGFNVLFLAMRMPLENRDYSYSLEKTNRLEN
jgi:hypothetical protein